MTPRPYNILGMSFVYKSNTYIIMDNMNVITCHQRDRAKLDPVTIRMWRFGCLKYSFNGAMLKDCIPTKISSQPERSLIHPYPQETLAQGKSRR